jgi:lipoprotein NlpD
MTDVLRSGWQTAAAMSVAALLTACAAPRPAPVESRSPVLRPELPAVASTLPASNPPPVAKPSEYVVKPGDTLIRIGLETGQNWRDIVRWNNLENPNVIEVGQVLRVVPPPNEATVAAVRPAAGAAEVRPIEPRAAAPAAAPVAAPASGAVAQPVGPSAPAPTSTAAPAVAPTPTPASPPVSPPNAAASAAAAKSVRDPDEDIVWGWPAAGPVATAFDETRNKGIAITGRAGDPVLAAADGRVVYAGAGLRGYGNLVIVKHNNTYLSAYAHNQTLLVKEDQAVRRGQKIAEMGSTDADRVQLHFEIRRQGRPVDPARLLPPR